MNGAPRPSPVRRTAAVALATIAGVAVVLLLLWIAEPLTAPSPDEQTGYLPFAFFFPIGLLIGSVIGIPLCLLIGIPLWHLALSLDWHRRREAAGCGAVAGMVIAVLLTVLLGEPTMTVRWKDALLFIGIFVIAGTCAGLVARQIAYPN